MHFDTFQYALRQKFIVLKLLLSLNLAPNFTVVVVDLHFVIAVFFGVMAESGKICFGAGTQGDLGCKGSVANCVHNSSHVSFLVIVMLIIFFGNHWVFSFFFLGCRPSFQVLM